MEKNTVLLDLEDYNELREFKEKTESGLIPVWSGCEMYYYYSKAKAIKKIVEINNALNKQCQELKDKIAGKPKETTLKDIKKMSIWQFIKWRRNG